MKIFADSGIEKVLTDLFSQIGDQDVNIVQLEQARAGVHLQDVIGLDDTLDVAKNGTPVVMLGWMTPKMYIDRKPQEWFAVMGYPNVMFRRLPATLEDVVSAVEEVKVGSRQPDPLAIALLGVDQTNTTIRVLHHDLLSAERDAERMIRWVERAQAVFGDKPEAELVSLAKVAGKAGGLPSALAGQGFPDVCVDVEGTLLTSDGQIRSEVLALAEEKANGGPITVWTGGNIYDLTKQLRDAGVLHKIASKHTMKGATVRVVIDDQPEDAFKSDYGVSYGEYIQV